MPYCGAKQFIGRLGLHMPQCSMQCLAIDVYELPPYNSMAWESQQHPLPRHFIGHSLPGIRMFNSSPSVITYIDFLMFIFSHYIIR